MESGSCVPLREQLRSTLLLQVQRCSALSSTSLEGTTYLEQDCCMKYERCEDLLLTNLNLSQHLCTNLGSTHQQRLCLICKAAS